MVGKVLRFLLSMAFLTAVFTLPVYAQEAEHQGGTLEAAGFDSSQRLGDGNRNTYSRAGEGASVTVSRSGGIGALYIEFDRLPQPWRLTDPAAGKSVDCGENAFLHEFVDVTELFEGLPETLVMEFEPGTVVADIYAFSQGEMPDWVQRWEPPCEEADLLLISSHSDDEQLFFAGILPYYAVERGLKVQVAYLVQHFEAYGQLNHQRPHEQLDGLWTVGVRNYPVMSDFPDLYSESKDRDAAFAQAAAVYQNVGIAYEDFVGYVTECLRRFKPLVAVSHDWNGEYGHGTHVFCASALADAIDAAADEDQYPDSAAAYGLWEVEKVYLHLYPENPIVMDWDSPLDSLGGKTPFEVTQEGFGCHKSQHWTWFYGWIYGTGAAPIAKAADITSYSPCLYGLFYTKVGSDAAGGDFFENVETYQERAMAAAAEAAAKAAEEAERAAQEAAEAAAQEAARQAEEAARAEAARLEAEAVRQAEEKAAREARTAQILLAAGVIAAIVAAAMVFLVFLLRYRRSAKGRRRGSR